MSQISISQVVAGILGAVAVSVTFGAVQLASGSSLSGAPEVVAATAQSNLVNRSVKADRSGPVMQASASRTISVAPTGLDATSVLVRIPAVVAPFKSTNDNQRVLTPIKTARASSFACEPVVSVLTDVAKLLGPGRCIS